MAQNVAIPIEVRDIQFKLHRKINVFKAQNDMKNLMHLLAVASNKGLMFVANPYESEFKVFKLNEIDIGEQEITTRVVVLISPPLALACNCDGSMLAVSYVYNNTGFLQIFHVESFLKPEVNALYTLPVAAEYNVHTIKLLWNPVICNNLAIILNDGSAAMFTLNTAGQYEKHILGKEQQIKSGCWSPKGKQIVFGLGTGNLQQFKPNLTPARIINFPNDMQKQSFDIIEVQWLSTFQFAVILLERGVDLLPCLYIVNAPKVGVPNFTNYDNMYLSTPGLREQQFILTHIPTWNLLLVTSATAVEIGLLGTKENNGDYPTWLQYSPLGEARIEMPLTDDGDETYPMGFALDTSCSHQLIVCESKLPVQPIVHVLNTNGQLVSYNFLNLLNGIPNICSPPPPLIDNSGQFVPLEMTILKDINASDKNRKSVESVVTNTDTNQYGPLTKDVTFTIASTNMITSTPMAKENTSFLFSNNSKNNNAFTTLGTPFNTTTTSSIIVHTATTTMQMFNYATSSITPATVATTTQMTNIFSKNFNNENNAMNIFGQMQNNNSVTVGLTVSCNNSSNFLNSSNDIYKPLYTVPSTFMPPSIIQDQSQGQQYQQERSQESNDQNNNVDKNQIDEIIKCMLKLQIDAFENELKELRTQSLTCLKNQLGNIDDVKRFSKQLNNIQEIISQANDREFETDLQILRSSMKETYIIVNECRSKLNIYQNPDYMQLMYTPQNDAVSRRQLTKLRNYVTSNENYLKQSQQILDTQWHEFQDIVRRNSKQQMHIPCLDSIYQKMSKIKDVLARERQKLQLIKNKMKECGILYKPPVSELSVQQKATNALIRNESATILSLTDSMISMSLAEKVIQKQSQLSSEKLQAIRDFTKQQNRINIIKPKRPERIGLKSEVILETKLKTERKQTEQKKSEMLKSGVTMQQQQQQYVNIKPQAQIYTLSNQSMNNVAKPHASKPQPAAINANMFNAPYAASSVSSNLNISSSSSFVKTSSVMNDSMNTNTNRVSAASTPFVPYTSTNLTLNFSQQQQNKLNEKDMTQLPVSFNAKIIQSNNELTKSTGINIPTSKSSTNQLSMKTIGKDQHISEQASIFSINKPIMNVSTEASSTGAFSFSGLGSVTSFTTSKESSHTNSDSKSAVSSSTPLFVGFNNPVTATCTNVSSPFSKPPETKVQITTNTTTITQGSKQDGINSSLSSSTSSNNTMIITTNAQTGTNFAVNSSKFIKDTVKAVTAPTTVESFQKALDLTPSNNSDSETVLNSLNICKPTTRDDSNDESIKSVNTVTTNAAPFSFLNTASTLDSGSTNIFSQFGSTGNTFGNSIFNFSTGVTQSIPSGTSITPVASRITATTTITTTTTKTIIPSAVSSSEAKPPETTIISSSAVTGTESNSVFSVVSTTASVTPLFGALNLTTSVGASTNTTGAITTTVQSTTGNIFGRSQNIFGQTNPSVPVTTSGTFSFGQSTNMFGGVGSTTAVASSIASPTTTASTGSGNIFGGVPKPDQSIFGGVANTPSSTVAATPSGLFASAAASTKSMNNSTGINIFGGSGSLTFNSSPSSIGSSLFGGSTSTAVGVSPFASATNGSLFGAGNGNQMKSSTDAGSIFGSSNAQAASGSSIFGKSTFGQSPTNASNANIFNNQSQTTTLSNPFSGSSARSIFGGSSSANTSGGSLFGSSTQAFGSAPPTGTQTFGSFTSQQAPTTSPFSSPTGFAQSGASVQQSGFGGLTQMQQPQQQTSAFAKPVFGGPATFGQPTPAFGGQPTFGSAPTFGSPKGFGSFSASTTVPTSPPGTNAIGGGMNFCATNQTKANIFETLGSSESGLSFGNLAQNTQQPVQPKPTFGGSSFMNYRS